MTVGELIERLQKCDPGLLVVLAADREGNSYSPLDLVALGLYVAETTWQGHLADVSIRVWRGQPEEGEVAAVVFWPVN